MTSERCRQFLTKHGLYYGQYFTPDISGEFLREMDRGLAGAKSSLAMIPSYIHVPSATPQNQKIIAIDAGGTNFRTSVISFDGNGIPHREYFTNNSMPGTEKELSCEDFFQLIADYIEPVLKKSNRLGLCFSYPARIDYNRDGTLLYWTKEVKAPGVVGQKILAGIAATLKKRKLPCPAYMYMLNDTVASLLAGVSAMRFSREYGFVGFILGTGSNTAYVEKNSAITKETNLPRNRTMIVNCESGNFDKINRGDLDIAFDGATASPGSHVLEKMISGGYLGGLCRHTLAAATTEGLLSPEAHRQLDRLDFTGAAIVSAFIAGRVDELPALRLCPVADLETIRVLLDAIVERAALLAAVNMSAPILKSVRDGSDIQKFCIVADGAVYHKLYSFKERAEKYLAEILRPTGVTCAVVKIDEAPLIGTAVAGLA